jgi:cytochrome c oxidase subunit 2
MKFNSKVACALALMFAGTLALSGGVADAQKKPKPSPKPAPASPEVAKGKKVYESNGCAACHAVAGKGGKTGPDLSKYGKTAKADKVATQIRDPKKVKPEGSMPAYNEEQISEKELKALTAYLLSLK